MAIFIGTIGGSVNRYDMNKKHPKFPDLQQWSRWRQKEDHNHILTFESRPRTFKDQYEEVAFRSSRFGNCNVRLIDFLNHYEPINE